MVCETSRLHSSEQFQRLRCKVNRKKSKFECKRLVSTVDVDWLPMVRIAALQERIITP
jgi:hypothetical protein